MLRLLIIPSLFIMVATVSASPEPGGDVKNNVALAAKPANCQAIKSPDGSDFDWDAIRSNDDMKACLLQLAKNLRTPDRMADWLQRQGFYNVVASSNIKDHVFLNATWGVKRSGSRVPFAANMSFLRSLLTKGKTYTVQIVYKDGTPKYAKVGFILI